MINSGKNFIENLFSLTWLYLYRVHRNTEKLLIVKFSIVHIEVNPINVSLIPKKEY